MTQADRRCRVGGEPMLIRSPIEQCMIAIRSCLMLTAFALLGCSAGPGPHTAEHFNHWSDQSWVSPPRQFRPMIRWWWPGGNVTGRGITAELGLLDELGFGGVEIQPFTFGLPAEGSAVPAVRTVGDSTFVAKLDHAFAEARRRGMGVDLTISSGWGLGGPLECAECGEHQLLMTETDVVGPGQIDLVIPRPNSTPYDGDRVVDLLGLGGPFDSNLELVAVVRGRLADSLANTNRATVTELLDVTARVQGDRLRMDVPEGQFRIFGVFANRTNTRLVGAAYPGDPSSFRMIDHLDRRGLAAFRHQYLDAVSDALEAPPDHYFVDSFEFVTDLPWTPSFLDSFTRSRGYDLGPYLPLLFNKGGEFSFVGPTPPRVVMDGVGQRVREDYEDVRAELFMTEFIGPLGAVADEQGAGLRLQALGGYGDYLDVFGAVDTPESEDFGLNGRVDFLRLASSAANVAGRRTVSNEAFVVNSNSSTALTEEDYLRLAGRAFAAGINQLVVHGRAYPTDQNPSDRWYPFSGIATTRLDETNPIWPRLNDLTTTVARLSYAMSLGRRHTRVAWVMSDLRPPDFDQPLPPPTSQEQDPYPEPNPISRVLRQHGVDYDRVSRRAVASSARVCDGRLCIGDASYDLLLLANAVAASIHWLGQVHELATAGIPVVVVGSVPTRARGFAEAARRDEAVRAEMARLARLPAFEVLSTADDLGPLLRTLTARGSVRPADPETWHFATIGRALATEEILLVFNGSGADDVAVFEVLRPIDGVVLNPEDGAYSQGFEVAHSEYLRVAVPAGRSRVIRFRLAPD